jgi:mRNA interferase MazF
MTPDQGDLILLPFPFTDLSAHKRRPAIVVSPNRFHALSNDRIIVAVTSNLDVRHPGGQIPLSSRDLIRGSLPRPSVVLPGKIFTIHRSLVVKRIGRLRTTRLHSILNTLQALFASDAARSGKG